MVEGVYWIYCGQFRCCTIGAKQHSTITHIRRAVPLENLLGTNPPAAPSDAPAPHDGVLSQYGSDNNTVRGANLKASMAADLGGDPGIRGYSVYDGESLSLMVHIFIGGAVTSKFKHPITNDVDVGATDFCSGGLFFGYELHDKLDYDALYDAVEILHKTETIATYTAIPTPGDEPPPSNHPVNQYSDSSDSEDDPEPPDHALPVK